MTNEKTVEFILNKYEIQGQFESLFAHGKMECLEKGCVIKQAGKKEQQFRILIKGAAIATIYTDSAENCIDLFFEEEFCLDISSFIHQKNSEIEISLIEDCTFFVINYTNFFALDALNSEILSVVTDLFFTRKQNQQIGLLSKTPLERLQELEKKYGPHLFRIPKFAIASYLGITPQSLSRLLRKTLSVNLG
ncbi:MAG: Crp/Fnr family transcriptional regulator [Flavobacteriales bacterium]